MKVLGIESSCDETAIAIVDDQKNILSHVIKSQIDIHQIYGGVVPELSARHHLEIVDLLIIESLNQANLKFKDIDGFAGTSGPGLIGGLIVGMTCAKTLASIHQKAFLAINHLQGHALAIRLENDIAMPFLILLVSGGHCQILLCRAIDDFVKIGETIDDALGETFDKVAQMLGLKYPGGPEIEKLANQGNSRRFIFPKPLIDRSDINHQYNFSFSGLKTAVKRQIEKLTNSEFLHDTSPNKLSLEDKADICASFQKTISDILLNRLENVVKKTELLTGFNNKKLDLVITGGVACNQFIFKNLQQLASKYNFNILIPSKKLCTDNAIMIAWAGIEKLIQVKRNKNFGDPLNFKPRSKWDLDQKIVI
ncbi:tRNA N6-adenosine threonylcarbamoyltransferase [Alphaproteobacteria bacterium]|nr:tRNA N6-adenosine threonylcarbamoyltransferase [Alphaproteobacteria bacterium]